MREFIIESALLTHGLKSISSERLKQELDKKWKIAWLDYGRTIEFYPEDGVLEVRAVGKGVTKL